LAEDVVIRVEELGKKYMIGHQAAERATTLRDAITRSSRQWARSVRDIVKGAANVSGDEIEEFWALKGLSFEIHRGDVVGIIGRNGAGKSTLLKVLSRITEPSEGRVEIRGRIASLLEVGTGFHPELSGRENVYLNGAILGMSQAEIKRKFDEIVAFAEVEKFLDTPVKRYSSGMYVRLAFAVAAHLEPEILIIDEVLAVGDAEFQKKCLGQMQNVAGQGRTVLFVSHNMAAIQQLCSEGILLHRGQKVASGKPVQVIKQYVSNTTASRRVLRDRQGIFIAELNVLQSYAEGAAMRANAPIQIEARFSEPISPKIALGLRIVRDDGVCVHHVSDEFTANPPHRTKSTIEFPANSFSAGDYRVEAAIGIRNVELLDECDDLTFIVEGSARLQERTTGAWLGATSPEIGTWRFVP
jgi:lipopolysaccharide transport system ATP-binding protein